MSSSRHRHVMAIACGHLAHFPMTSSRVGRGKCSRLSARSGSGTECAQFWRSMISVFSDHAPPVIAISLPAPSRTAPAPTKAKGRTTRPTPTRAGPTPTGAGKAVERATRSDPYSGSPHDPAAAPAAANDSSLLDEVGVGEAELSRRCARHGSRPIGSCAKRKRSRKRRDRECSLNNATPP